MSVETELTDGEVARILIRFVSYAVAATCLTIVLIGHFSARGYAFLAARKRYWLLPAIIALATCLLLFALTEGSTP